MYYSPLRRSHYVRPICYALDIIVIAIVMLYSPRSSCFYEYLCLFTVLVVISTHLKWRFLFISLSDQNSGDKEPFFQLLMSLRAYGHGRDGQHDILQMLLDSQRSPQDNMLELQTLQHLGGHLLSDPACLPPMHVSVSRRQFRTNLHQP